MTSTLSNVAAVTPLAFAVSFPGPDAMSLAVAGEIDMRTAPVLGMRLLAVLERRDCAVVDVDLSGVTFLDCAAIGMLVAVRSAAARIGITLRLSVAAGIVVFVLEVTGVGALFTVPIIPPPPPNLAALRISDRHRQGVATQIAA